MQTFKFFFLFHMYGSFVSMHVCVPLYMVAMDTGPLGLSLHSFFICSVQPFNMLGWPQLIYAPQHCLILAPTPVISFTILSHLYILMSKFIENNIMAYWSWWCPTCGQQATYIPHICLQAWTPGFDFLDLHCEMSELHSKLSSDHTWTMACVGVGGHIHKCTQKN